MSWRLSKESVSWAAGVGEHGADALPTLTPPLCLATTWMVWTPSGSVAVHLMMENPTPVVPGVQVSVESPAAADAGPAATSAKPAVPSMLKDAAATNLRMILIYSSSPIADLVLRPATPNPEPLQVAAGESRGKP